MTILYKDDIVKVFNKIWSGEVDGREFTFVLVSGRKVKLSKNKFAGEPAWLEGFVSSRRIDVFESTSPYAEGLNEYSIDHDSLRYTTFKPKTLPNGKQVIATVTDDNSEKSSLFANPHLDMVYAVYKDNEYDASLFTDPISNQDIENTVSLLFDETAYAKYFEIDVVQVDTDTVSIGYVTKTIPNPYLLQYNLIPNEPKMSHREYLVRLLHGVLHGTAFIDNENVMQQIHAKVAMLKSNYAKLGYTVV